MKKVISTIVIAVSAFSINANAQVGVNTTAPAVTLDVIAKNASGTTTNTDGFLMPRVDRQRAQNMTAVPVSTLIYVNSIATGAAVGIAVNILSVGYYYFDGLVWVKLNAPNATSVVTAEVASQTGANFNVTNLAYTPVSGTPQTMTIPSGGKALFINFMLGIDYNNSPAGGGTAYYKATLFVDGVATNAYQVTQEPSTAAQAQFNLSTVIYLAAGSHTLDVRMIRSANNGTTSGAVMQCIPISVSFNASYLN